MIAELWDRRDEVAELGRRFGFRRLELFGSATSGEFDPARSDIDFHVELEPPEAASRIEVYFGLKDGLEIVGEALGQLRRAAPDIAAGVPDLARISQSGPSWVLGTHPLTTAWCGRPRPSASLPSFPSWATLLGAEA